MNHRQWRLPNLFSGRHSFVRSGQMQHTHWQYRIRLHISHWQYGVGCMSSLKLPLLPTSAQHKHTMSTLNQHQLCVTLIWRAQSMSVTVPAGAWCSGRVVGYLRVSHASPYLGPAILYAFSLTQLCTPLLESTKHEYVTHHLLKHMCDVSIVVTSVVVCSGLRLIERCCGIAADGCGPIRSISALIAGLQLFTCLHELREHV